MVDFSGVDIIRCDNEALWLEERRRGVGASESPVLFGSDVSSWGSPFDLWAVKTGQIAPAPLSSDAARWGRHLEGPIADAYSEETGRQVRDLGRNTLLRSRAHSFLQATLDRVVEDAELGVGVLEIKNVGAHRLDEWVGTPPLRYQVQVQHQMAVTGDKWGALAVLVGGQKLIRFDIERDDAFIASLVELCGDFMAKVESKTPPPADGSEATARALAELYAVETGKAVELGARFVALDAEMQALKAKAQEIENRTREIRNEFLAAIGDAERGIIINGPVYVRQEIKKKAHTSNATSYRQLRRVDCK